MKIRILFYILCLGTVSILGEETFFRRLRISSNLLLAQEEPAVGEGTVKEEIKEEIIKAPTEPLPILEIRRLETEEPLYSIELRNVDLADLFRVIAHDYNLNILVDKDVKGKVTASFTNISLEEALNEIAESNNLTLVKKGNIIRVVPNLITRIFLLKHIEAKRLLEGETTAQIPTEEQAPGTAMGATGETTPPGGAQVTAGVKEMAQITEEAKQQNTIFDLLSEDGKVFLGKQPNSLMVIDYPKNIAKIEEFINMVDQRMTSRVFKLKYLKASDIVGQVEEVEAPAVGRPETAATPVGAPEGQGG